MAGDTTITVIGNLTGDPELRYTPNGVAVTNFTVASTPRVFDRTINDWKDGEALFLRCSVWREAAENLAESLTRGARVIVSGRLKQRNWTTDDGQKRSTVELDVDEIGPSLRYATAKVHRTTKSPARSAKPATETEGSAQLVGAAVGASQDPWAGGSGWGTGDDPEF
ncbi:single-stranded DNA-binding protein [Nocardia bhagyanarayanae]|uniref:Single-stranded DNA-binding protein n=1 Tax=Nocardia bhagyanarayanae TaxID=1215925 RepID=A0A543FG47_9NOCA|nr:single-stranded DNA-binding protein [Nocardia bhagyanarayanae]TQM32724.1 single-strand DNA-binding protein [Nocardia bhagyanarayanae]